MSALQKIGEGWFYEVFDLDNGRVLKKRRSFTSMAERFNRAYFLRGIYKWFKGYNYAMRSAYAIGRMKTAIEGKPTLQKLLGNPVFVGDTDYEQDKVVIVKDALTGVFETDMHLIDGYIANIISCWEFGFADTVYNFTINNGLNEWGDVVLIDFNEVTMSKQEVRTDIVAKRWRKAHAIGQIGKKLRDYYFEQMDLRVTLEALEEHWPKFGAPLKK